MFNIHCAAYLGAYDTVESSIQCDTLNKLNLEGWSPLMYACSSHRLRVIDLLLRCGAGANFPGTKGLTPLMIASRLGAIDVARHLLQHMNCIEFGINVADAEGWTALFHAVYMAQEETVKFLLSHGAKVNVIDKNKQNVLMVAARASEKKVTNVFKVLADAGAESMSPRREASFIAEKYDCLPDLRSLFRFLDIEKYYRIFNDRNIGIQQFLMLTENDLRVLGVKCLGPRRKMSLAICQLGNKFHIKSQMD